VGADAGWLNCQRAVLPRRRALVSRRVLCHSLLCAESRFAALHPSNPRENREDAEKIERRLARGGFAMPTGIRHHVILQQRARLGGRPLPTITPASFPTACYGWPSSQKIKSHLGPKENDFCPIARLILAR